MRHRWTTQPSSQVLIELSLSKIRVTLALTCHLWVAVCSSLTLSLDCLGIGLPLTKDKINLFCTIPPKSLLSFSLKLGFTKTLSPRIHDRRLPYLREQARALSYYGLILRSIKRSGTQETQRASITKYSGTLYMKSTTETRRPFRC